MQKNTAILLACLAILAVVLAIFFPLFSGNSVPSPAVLAPSDENLQILPAQTGMPEAQTFAEQSPSFTTGQNSFSSQSIGQTQNKDSAQGQSPNGEQTSRPPQPYVQNSSQNTTAQSGQQEEMGEQAAIRIISQRPQRGAEDANVTIVEFSDYQCPFTRQLNPIIDALMSEYGGKIKRVFINYPINSIHPQAERAAEAAECANDQGKFWEYHDKLFEGSSLSEQNLVAYAKNLSLDMQNFSSCLDSGEKRGIINEQTLLGNSNGVEATPTFFINGRKIEGMHPSSDFRKAIDAAISFG
ncbi:MAG: thioredoxin domain-containing protein [Candidatus Micrarchaeota archaeon]